MHVLRKEGGLLAANEALLALQTRVCGCVLAVGDWNGDVRNLATDDVQACVPGVPTTFVDAVYYPESHGIDAALVMAPPLGALLTVEVDNWCQNDFVKS